MVPFTCADTLCKSYVKKASKEAGSAAAGREDKKVDKYSNLSDYYHFVPVGVETYANSRRMEKSLRLQNADLLTEYNLVEAGLHRPKVKAANLRVSIFAPAPTPQGTT